ncbi:MAG: PP2C family protein-serine/threonine phosphatase [Cytophagales bacterium]
MEKSISGEHLKKLELNALLEITTAISQNVSKEDLFKIFKFTLKGNHLIQKVALFLKEENNQWYCATSFGVKLDLEKITKEILESIPKMVHEPRGKYDLLFEDFDVVMPVYHKDQIFAYVFVDGDEAFGEDVRNERFDFIQTLSNIILYALENKKMFVKQLEQQALNKELEIASKVQSQLIPSRYPTYKNVKFSSKYIPHSKIGGDYYDLIAKTKTQFYACIADVSGKGVPAAIFMSNFQASLRVLIETDQDLSTIVQKLNKYIVKNTGGEYFITFFIALIDIENKTIEYINSGHNHPYLLNQNTNEVMVLDKGSTFLGAFDKLPSIVSEKLSIENSLLLLYTDGLSETNNTENEEYGEERIKNCIIKHSESEIDVLTQSLINELDTFRTSAPYKDDITIFGISLSFENQ